MAEKDVNPVNLIVLILQAFSLMFWLGTSNTSINPVAGNVSITNQYSSSFTNTEWILWLLAPLSIYMIATQGFHLGRDEHHGSLGMEGSSYNPVTGAMEDEE